MKAGDFLLWSIGRTDTDGFYPTSIGALWRLDFAVLARLTNDTLETVIKNNYVMIDHWMEFKIGTYLANVNKRRISWNTTVIGATAAGNGDRLTNGSRHVRWQRASVFGARNFWRSGANALLARIFRCESIAQIHRFVAECTNRIFGGNFKMVVFYRLNLETSPGSSDGSPSWINRKIWMKCQKGVGVDCRGFLPTATPAAGFTCPQAAKQSSAEPKLLALPRHPPQENVLHWWSTLS